MSRSRNGSNVKRLPPGSDFDVDLTLTSTGLFNLQPIDHEDDALINPKVQLGHGRNRFLVFMNSSTSFALHFQQRKRDSKSELYSLCFQSFLITSEIPQCRFKDHVYQLHVTRLTALGRIHLYLSTSEGTSSLALLVDHSNNEMIPTAISPLMRSWEILTGISY